MNFETMQLSELISRLQAILQEHGDLPAYHCFDTVMFEIGPANVYMYTHEDWRSGAISKRVIVGEEEYKESG